MKFKFDHDYHIHSYLSTCSDDPEQSPARILKYALETGLSEICITDHYWDGAVPGASDWYKPQDFEHISRVKPLPEAEGVKFLFGCETDMDKLLTVGIPKERFSDFDFVIIPTTHLHMTDFTITKEDAESNEARARLWVRRLDALLGMPLPFEKIGIAHLACGLIDQRSRQDYLDTLSLIPDGDMNRLFKKAASVGAGIELNLSDMTFRDGEEDFVLRPFRIAKACGCKFYLGSDAHHPKSFERCRPIFERAIDMLDLSEDDRFYIGNVKSTQSNKICLDKIVGEK